MKNDILMFFDQLIQNEINQLRLLILENGGNDLNTIKNKIYPTFSNDDKKKFFTSLLTLIDGVDFFVKNNIFYIIPITI